MSRLRHAGYGGLILLTLALPFDTRHHPLLQFGLLRITPLSILLYAVAALAVVTLSLPFSAFVRNVSSRTYDPTNYFYRQRVPVLLFAALLISCTISGVLAGKLDAWLDWMQDLLTGGLLWLAIPLWMGDEPEVKVKRIGIAIVTGAVLAGVVGLGEFLFGPGFDQRLTWFKSGATTVGPYLRLSGTFSHANVAAMWFGLTLPFAIAGLGSELAKSSRRWLIVVAWLMAIDVLLAALLLTYSRGGLIGLAVGITTMAVATRENWHMKRRIREWKWVLGFGIAVGLVLGSFALASWPVEAQRFSSLSGRNWYMATYSSELPSVMRTGHIVAVRVTVGNESAVTWRASGSPTYKLSYHWLYSSKQMEQLEGIRTELPSNVAPGNKQTVLAEVRAPSRPGSYFLVWDMMLGNGTWFSLRAAQYKPLPVRVINGSRHKAANVAVKLPDPADPTKIPAAPSPDREQIWSVALRMVETHPLFGVGPHGVGLHYADFVKTPRSIYGAQPPGHAHSLILEIAADFGLVGGGLFAAWFVTVWRPLFVGTWTGRMVGSWRVALVGSIGMFLGHGLVDYTLQSLSLFILFSVLAGLATSMAESRSAAA